jgi:hypothetical protein
METVTYNDMSLVCCLCAMTSSKWNQKEGVGKHAGVFRVTNTLLDPTVVSENSKPEEDCKNPIVDPIKDVCSLEKELTNFIGVVGSYDVFCKQVWIHQLQ